MIIKNNGLVSLEKKLKAFDKARWSVACRHMQIRLIHNNVDAAVSVLRAFIRSTERPVATLDSPTEAVFRSEVAFPLTKEGHIYVRSVSLLTDHQLLNIDGIGRDKVDEIHETIAKLKRHEILEDFVDDWGLLDSDLFVDPSEIQNLEALEHETLTERIERLEAELASLRSQQETERGEGWGWGRSFAEVEAELVRFLSGKRPQNPSVCAKALRVTLHQIRMILNQSDKFQRSKKTAAISLLTSDARAG